MLFFLVHLLSDINSELEDELNRQAGLQLRQTGGRKTSLSVPSSQVLYNTLATHRKIVITQVCMCVYVCVWCVCVCVGVCVCCGCGCVWVCVRVSNM